MPNHVTNRIKFSGDPERIRAIMEGIKHDEMGLGSVDFNKIIPMPESLNITAGSITDKGLEAYKDFVSVNALLSTIPDNKRIFSIESGSRELSLVRKNDDGVITNNVVHTLSRPSDNEAYDITQEDLVVASLRFNPDIVVVGEMRDTEAYSAVEASLTGHTVVSTIRIYLVSIMTMMLIMVLMSGSTHLLNECSSVTKCG